MYSSMLFLTVFAASLIIGIVSSPVSRQQQYNDNFPPQQQLQAQEYPIFGASEFTPWHNQTRQRMAATPRGKLETNGTWADFNASTSAAATSLPGTPNKCNLVPSHLCFSETVQSFRDREMRLNAIKHYVLNTLGQGRLPASALPPSSQPQVSQQVSRSSPSSPFSGKLQTLFVSCDLPLNVDWDTWFRSGLFHLYFNITGGTDTTVQQATRQPPINPFQTNQNIPTAAPFLSSATVISAKLKLFKKGTDSSRASLLLAAPTKAEPCNDTNVNAIEKSAPTVQIPVLRNSFDLNTNVAVAAEEKIRVSIYWYTTPVSKHHYKKKLLDTKMLSIKEDEWVEFDIQKAAKEWVERGTNYGLTIEVENEDDDLIDPSKFFASVLCKNSTGLSEGISSLLTPSEQTPLLEICTLSLPTSPSASASDLAPNPFLSSAMATRTFKIPRSSGSFQTWRHLNTGDEHRRTRHHHGMPQENTVGGNYASKKDFSKQEGRILFSGSSDENAMQQDDASNIESTTKFELDAHHPLRHIFATASTKFGRNRNRRRYFKPLPIVPDSNDNSASADRVNQDETLTSDINDDEVDGNQVKKVIIENFFLEPTSSSHGSRFGSSRTR